MAGRIAALALLLLLTGCAVEEAQTAKRGRSELVGLSKTDLQMCAGHPANADKFPGGEIWMYEHGVASSGGVTVTPVIPVAGAQIGQQGGGYCRVQLRLVKDKVTEVAYAGAIDELGGPEAVCAPIVRGCLDYGKDRR